MRVGIYCAVVPPRLGGVGRRLAGLLSALGRDPEGDPHTYRLYAGRRQTLPPLEAGRFDVRRLPVDATSRVANHLYAALFFPLRAAADGLDVVDIPNTMPVVSRLCPTVVTIHDLAEFALRESIYAPQRAAYRRLANRLAARRATAIITGSAAARDDIVHYLGVPADKIHVIYPGLDPRFHSAPPTPAVSAAVRRRYSLPPRYVLFVGKIQPRKNLPRLLAALARARRILPDLRLVIAGQRGWLYAEVDQAIAAHELSEAVHFTGFVADEDLPHVYRLAAALAFPSLFEGFGFPILEAMAVGLPVVTANVSSMPEIAGDAALCVAPQDEDGLAAAIVRAVADETLRAELRAKGLARAATFSWEACARATRQVYENLGG